MLRGTMLLQLCAPLVVAAALIVAVTADCDASSDNQMTRICALENDLAVMKNAVQELLQRADLTLDEEVPMVEQKRKNEFIRFGKRSAVDEKRKNEFIRFGKRKNEFIRFGRSAGELEDGEVTKRKNEFIRFG